MSQINVDTIRSRTGTAPQLDKGAEVTVGYGVTGAGGVNISGFATAGGFVGDLTGDVTGDVTGNADTATTATNAQGLTGAPDVDLGNISAAGGDLTIRNVTGVAATFTGALTYDDVTNVDSIGIVTARGGFEIGASGVGGTITAAGNAEFTGVCTATSFYGDGSTLTNAGITAGKAMGLASFLIY